MGSHGILVSSVCVRRQALVPPFTLWLVCTNRRFYDYTLYPKTHSPFGKRCTGIHDPRIGGKYESWLPHTETQGNTLATDINVEALHQKRLNAILHGNPFGNLFSLKNDTWSDLYKLVCNIDYVKNGWVDKKRQRTAVHPIVKIQIALQMRGDAEWQYKFRPQHVIHDELCMVLQKRAFFITDDLLVQEIPVSSFHTHRHAANHVMVREIAFGPDSDPAVRGVALWFAVKEEDVLMCTPQQAKRFRWKRSLKKEDNNDDNSSQRSSKSSTSKPSVFDSADSFAMIRPHDRAAFDLTTDMMKHRLVVLQTERMSNMRERFEALRVLEAQKAQLQRRFENLQTDWRKWSWPINRGREHVDKSTLVPKVDGEYEIGGRGEGAGDKKGSQLGEAVRPVWESFVKGEFKENVPKSVSCSNARPASGSIKLHFLIQSCYCCLNRNHRNATPTHCKRIRTTNSEFSSCSPRACQLEPTGRFRTSRSDIFPKTRPSVLTAASKNAAGKRCSLTRMKRRLKAMNGTQFANTLPTRAARKYSLLSSKRNDEAAIHRCIDHPLFKFRCITTSSSLL